ncbi:unnamed protein product, partial [marine sediment metagenome]
HTLGGAGTEVVTSGGEYLDDLMGGGGDEETTTTYNYDQEASDALVRIAQRKQEVSDEQWEMYKEHFQGYEIATAKNREELLPYISDVSKKMYTEALEGIDPKKRADSAGAAVTSALRSERESAPREMSRYGIDPGSSRFRTGLEEKGIRAAELTAGARNRATESAERESFSRLGGALGMRNFAEGPTADPAGRAMASSAQAASMYAPLATRVLSTSSTAPKTSFWDFAGGALGTAAGAYMGGAI